MIGYNKDVTAKSWLGSRGRNFRTEKMMPGKKAEVEIQRVDVERNKHRPQQRARSRASHVLSCRQGKLDELAGRLPWQKA